MTTSDSTSELNFAWYGIVSGNDLEQGDLLNNFPIPILPPSIADLPDFPVGQEIDSPPVRIERFNIIVMTQACDLTKFHDEDTVLLCPCSSYAVLTKEDPRRWGNNGWKPIIQGRIVGAHILNKCKLDRHEFDYQVVNLQQIFSIPLALVKRVASNQGSRVRLLPPYREHLAQAFARQFMRVGLPIDLPREYPY